MELQSLSRCTKRLSYFLAAGVTCDEQANFFKRYSTCSGIGRNVDSMPLTSHGQLLRDRVSAPVRVNNFILLTTYRTDSTVLYHTFFNIAVLYQYL